MNNKTQIILFVSIIFSGCFFLFFFPSQAIKIRNFLFTKSFTNSVYNDPSHNNILFDEYHVISKYKKFKKSLIKSKSLLPIKFKSNKEIETIVAISNITDTVYNGLFAGGGTYTDLYDLEDHLLNSSRGGRCSDYSEYFLSQLLLYGFSAREVSNLNHTGIEVYVNSLRKWIWVDSQFDLFILNSKGDILNAIEIRETNKNELIFFCFNKKLNGFYKKFPECYITNNPFSQLVYSVDSRVFTLNDYRRYFSNRKIHSMLMTIFVEKRREILN